ncbi:MAG: hypothetical protein PHQ34_08135 [Methanothrix sp.]|nr:hypothetical protein [Methanothrix sp.]
MKWKRRFIRFVQPGQAAKYPSILRQFIRLPDHCCSNHSGMIHRSPPMPARTIAARYAEKEDSHPLIFL